MKKILAILMVLVLTLGALTACGTKEDKKDDNKVGSNQDDKGDKKDDDKADKKDDEKPADDVYEIALITDKGIIDDKSFNQGSWEGVVEFATANNISHQYYKPEEASDAGYLAAIELAITGGAKVVVTPGFLFEVAMYEAQTRYPEVKFILLDGAPHTADYSVFNTEPNVASVMYAEEESGYLAGYAAVMDGMRKLGFMGGMAVPAVQAFGYG